MRKELAKNDLLLRGDILGHLRYTPETGLDVDRIVDILRNDTRLAAELLSYGDVPIFYMGVGKDLRVDGRSLGVSFDRRSEYSTVEGDNLYGRILEQARDRYRAELRSAPLEETGIRKGQIRTDYSPDGSYLTKTESLEEEGVNFIHTEEYRRSRNAKPKFDTDLSGTTGHASRASDSEVGFHTFVCPFGMHSKAKVRVDTAAEVSLYYEKALRGELDWETLFSDLRRRGNHKMTQNQVKALTEELKAQFKWMREEISRNPELSRRTVVASTLLVPDNSMGRSIYDENNAPSPAHILARYINNPLLLYSVSENGVVRALEQEEKNEVFRFFRKEAVDKVNILVLGSDTIGGRVPGTRATKENGRWKIDYKPKQDAEKDYAIFSERLKGILSKTPPHVTVNLIASTEIGTSRLVSRYVQENGGGSAVWNFSRGRAETRAEAKPGSNLQVTVFEHMDKVVPVLTGEERLVSFIPDGSDSELSFTRESLPVDGVACFSVGADGKDYLLRENVSLAVSNGIPVVHVVDNQPLEQQCKTLSDGALISRGMLLGSMDFGVSLFDGVPRTEWNDESSSYLGTVLEDIAVPLAFERNPSPVYVKGYPFATMYGAYGAFLVEGMGKADAETLRKLNSAEDSMKGLVAALSSVMADGVPDDRLVETSIRKAVSLMAHANSSLASKLLGTGDADIVEMVKTIEDRTLFVGSDGMGENRFGVVLMDERSRLKTENEAERLREEAEQRAALEANVRMQKRIIGKAEGELVLGGLPKSIGQSEGAVWFLGTNRPLELTLPKSSPSFDYWNEGQKIGDEYEDPLTREKASRLMLDDDLGGRVENRLIFLFPTDVMAATGRRKVFNSPDSYDLTGVTRVDPATGKDFVCAYGIPVKKSNKGYEFDNNQGFPCSFLLNKDSTAFKTSLVNADCLARQTALLHGMALSFPVREDKLGRIHGVIGNVFAEKVFDYPRAKKIVKLGGKETEIIDVNTITEYQKRWVENPHRSEVNEAILKKYTDILTGGSRFPLNCIIMPSDDYSFVEGVEEARNEARSRFISDLEFSFNLANANAVASGQPLRFPLDESGRIDLGPGIPEEFRKIAENRIGTMINMVKSDDLVSTSLPEVHRVPLHKVMSREHPLERSGAELSIRPNDLLRAFGEFDFREIMTGQCRSLHEMAFIFEDGTRLRINDSRSTKGMSTGDINKYLRYEKNDEASFIVYTDNEEKVQYHLNVLKSYTELAKDVHVETRLVRDDDPELSEHGGIDGLEGLYNLLSSNSRELPKCSNDINTREVTALDLGNRFDGSSNDNEYYGWEDANDGFRGYAQYRYLLPDLRQSEWICIKDKELWMDVVLSKINRKYKSDMHVVPSDRVLEAELCAAAILHAGDDFRNCVSVLASKTKKTDDKVVDLGWQKEAKDETVRENVVKPQAQVNVFAGKGENEALSNFAVRRFTMDISKYTKKKGIGM